ncbi:MAG TPA: ThiF family adenylyltransferase [Ramlibacter sp.]|uniref:ThiF family adenylyltransferase n=1 Tax=Ramlibacter sp. TaxID=1917967 RepID=UPI002ECFE7AF
MAKYDRQSFLGPNSDKVLGALRVGLVGLGGGGSHVVQQLAHMGVRNFVLIDPDVVEETNLNRLVGATTADALSKIKKVEIAFRVVQGLVGGDRTRCIAQRWQEALPYLKGCAVIVGALDSVIAKDQLDAFCKRYSIVYIDIGMDVHKLGSEYLIAGQVVMTSPGGPCLRCLGVVTDNALAAEGGRYGAAGGKPQVVWPNGVLASLAVGLLAQQVTPWHAAGIQTAYLEYDGNKQTVRESPRLKELRDRTCPHHPKSEAGDARFSLRRPPAAQ